MHRDIKPGNIMVTANGTHAVLVDLGVAQLADDVDGKLTRTRQVVGTLRYASPQQVLAVEKLDRRTDIYSLGVTLWELLTLHPFLGATDEMPEPVLMEKIQHDEPAGVRSFHPQIPARPGGDRPKVPGERSATALPDGRRACRRPRAVLERRSGRGPAGGPRPPRLSAGQTQARENAGRRRWSSFRCPCSCLAYGYWDAHFRTKVEYYANFTKEFGVPRGIGRVSEEESHHRFVTWKFTLRGRQVESCEAVNGRGYQSVEHGMMAFIHRLNETKRECRYVYKRNADGDLEEEIALDRAGEVVWIFHFSTRTTGYYADKRGIPRARGGTGAAFLEFVFTDTGLARETHYLDKDGNPQANADNVFGFTSQFDERGLEVERRFLDSARNPALDSEGIAGFRLTYDKLGNRVEAVALAADGQPTLHKDGFAKWVRKYDRHGNVIEEAYLAADGRPVVVSGGYAKWRGEYDEQGDRVAEDYRGRRRSSPCFRRTAMPERPPGLTSAEIKSRRPASESTASPRCTRTALRSGLPAITSTTTPIEKAYFGVDGSPAVIKEGYAKWTSRYDEHGNHIEAAYFGIDGQPTMGKDGFAKWTARFDDRGNRIEEAYFGVDGRPTLNKDGAARFAYKYDERANLIETDLPGSRRPTHRRQGGPGEADRQVRRPRAPHRRCLFRSQRQADPRQRPLCEVDLSVRRARQLDRNGLLGNRRKSDRHSQRLRPLGGQVRRPGEPRRGVAISPSTARPALHKNGYARWKARFDDRHNRIEEAYFGTDDKPIVQKDGFSRWTAKYDERGRRVEEAYFGIDGKPVLNKEGIASWKARFDERGNEIEMDYFGIDGQPTLHRDGAAKWTARYDARDNQIERAFFGLHGEPVVLKEGFASWTARFDERGHRLEEAYFGVDGKPVLGKQGAARFTYKYDEFGNRVETAAFGLDGRPILLKEGYAKWTARFNARGNQVELAYFGVDGKPTLSQERLRQMDKQIRRPREPDRDGVFRHGRATDAPQGGLCPQSFPNMTKEICRSKPSTSTPKANR